MTRSKKRAPGAGTSRPARTAGRNAATPGGGDAGAAPPSPRTPARRWAWLALAAGALLAGVVVAMWLPRRSGPADTPLDLVRTADQNVLLVTIDTLRADALGCYGGRAATPALDRLAADGIRYDFAHAHAVVTLPSHTSILTGLYPPSRTAFETTPDSASRLARRRSPPC